MGRRRVKCMAVAHGLGSDWCAWRDAKGARRGVRLGGAEGAQVLAMGCTEGCMDRRGTRACLFVRHSKVQGLGMSTAQMGGVRTCSLLAQ